MGNCAGIDWASEKHDVLVEDPAGEELVAATFGHDEDGVSALCAARVCFDVDVVAIGRPDGLLVDRLLEAGMRVLALHPSQVKAARDRFAPRAVSPISSTGSCCASWPALTVTASVRWNPTLSRPRRIR